MLCVHIEFMLITTGPGLDEEPLVLSWPVISRVVVEKILLVAVANPDEVSSGQGKSPLDAPR